MSGISRDAWLHALGEAAAPLEQDSLSLAEIGKQYGISRITAARRMDELVKAGKARRTFKLITMVSGPRRRVPSYALIPEMPARKRG